MRLGRVALLRLRRGLTRHEERAGRTGGRGTGLSESPAFMRSRGRVDRRGIGFQRDRHGRRLGVGPGRPTSQRFWWLVAQYWTSEHLIEVLSISTEELAEAAGVPPTTAEAFASAFTSPWGTAKGLTLLRGRNEVRRRPLLRAKDDRLFPTAPGNLLWALRPTLEASLRRNAPVFEAYQARRAAMTERRAAEQFRRALKPEVLMTNLDFRTSSTNGEVDVLVRVDDLLILAEAKSGVLSDAAYSGRQAELRRDLGRLLGRSSEQASRLAKAIADREPVTFTDRATREIVDVDVEVDRVRSIVVTLEDLSAIVMRPHLLEAAGIVEDAAALPWCVSHFDLEVIAQSTQFPAQLTSYIDARLKIDPRAEWAGEEDLWMTHLLDRLDFSHVADDIFMVDGRTDLLVEQWSHGQASPRVRLPKATKKALQRLSRERPKGWLRETERLLGKALAQRRARVVTPSRPAG